MNSDLKKVDVRQAQYFHNRNSVIKRSILNIYVDTRIDNAISDRREAFRLASTAFVNEAVSALTVRGRGAEITAERHESVRPFILKILLFVGCNPNKSAFGLIARVIESRVKHPETDIRDVIANLSEMSGTAYNTLNRAVEKSFDIYDNDSMDRVAFLTGTQPLTAKDIINDLAIYVRMQLHSEMCCHE